MSWGECEEGLCTGSPKVASQDMGICPVWEWHPGGCWEGAEVQVPIDRGLGLFQPLQGAATSAVGAHEASSRENSGCTRCALRLLGPGLALADDGFLHRQGGGWMPSLGERCDCEECWPCLSLHPYELYVQICESPEETLGGEGQDAWKRWRIYELLLLGDSRNEENSIFCSSESQYVKSWRSCGVTAEWQSQWDVCGREAVYLCLQWGCLLSVPLN